MLWNRDMKQLGRAPMRVTAFCLILAIAIGLCSITAGLADAAEYATQAIEDMYITYGRVAQIDSSSSSYGSTSLEESTQAASARTDKINLASRLITMLSQGEIELESDVEIEFHSWLMAYDSSYMPLTTYGNELEDDVFLMNMPQALGCSPSPVPRSHSLKKEIISSKYIHSTSTRSPSCIRTSLHRHS